MAKKIVSAAEAQAYRPLYPERTARRMPFPGMCFDVEFQTWTNRYAMARSIRMQQAREASRLDWIACVPLTAGEGY